MAGFNDHGDFARFAADLHRTARDLPDELADAGETVGRTLRPLAQGHAVAELPHRGGLGAWMAARIASRVQRQPSLPGARIQTAAGDADLSGANDGTVIHPTYGGGAWDEQRIRRGFFTRAQDDLIAPWRRAALGALDRALRHL